MNGKKEKERGNICRRITIIGEVRTSNCDWHQKRREITAPEDIEEGEKKRRGLLE